MPRTLKTDRLHKLPDRSRRLGSKQFTVTSTRPCTGAAMTITEAVHYARTQIEAVRFDLAATP